MPEICRFYGIVIRMYHDDHPPPHFHAHYQGNQAVIEIGTLAVFAGRLPPRAMGLVVEWASAHQQELAAMWESAASYEPLGKIDPLP